MCEPSHSVVQFPDHNDDGDFQGTKVESLLGKVTRWTQKILSFTHLSRYACGHSENFTNTVNFYHLNRVQYWQYEGHWWNRNFIIDMGKPHEEAVDTAKYYSDLLVTGSLGNFRRFFEESTKKTEYKNNYFHAFFDKMLNQKGRQHATGHLKRFFGINGFSFGAVIREGKTEQLTKFFMGYTRKRNLLVPEWADDPKLWTPKQDIVMA